MCLFLILQFSSSYSIFCKLLITIVFTIIALGNTFFGVLNTITLKFLGEISYSTYLLHCIILFVIGYYVIGLENLKYYSKIEYLIKEIGELHHYKLLESLGEEITNKIKKEFDVKKILIKINKKNILPNTDFVGVILER